MLRWLKNPITWIASGTVGSRRLNHVLRTWPLSSGNTCSLQWEHLPVSSFLSVSFVSSFGMVTCSFLNRSLWSGESDRGLAGAEPWVQLQSPGGREPAITWSTWVRMGKGGLSRRKWGVAPRSGLARTSSQDIHQAFCLPSLCRGLLGKLERWIGHGPSPPWSLGANGGSEVLGQGKTKPGVQADLIAASWLVTHPAHCPIVGDRWGFWSFSFYQKLHFPDEWHTLTYIFMSFNLLCVECVMVGWCVREWM